MIVNEATQPTLHLFRALLRAATYLPDAAARTYFHNHIVKRFRETSTTTSNRLHKGRQSLSILERASHGELDPLRKVLFMTYGRAGKRRRELITELLKADEDELPADSDAVKTIIEKAQHGEAGSHSKNHKLMALVISMNRNHSEENPRAALRHITPKIPEESMWGKPLALKRQKSLQKKWWADTLDKIMPPLPAHEWNRLRDLATGNKLYEGPPPRRSGFIRQEPLQDDYNYFTRPITKAHEYDSVRQSRTPKRHNITTSYMRRLWSVVWKISPMMSKDDGKWTVVWGNSMSKIDNGKISAASKRDTELFSGAPPPIKFHERPKRSPFEKKLIRSKDEEAFWEKPTIGANE